MRYQLFSKKKVLAMNDECMHGKVDCMMMFEKFKILSASPSRKTGKLGIIILVLGKINKNSEIESYKASVI